MNASPVLPPAPLPAPPKPTPTAGLRALAAMRGPEGLLGAMRVFHADAGNVFQIDVPTFHPVLMAGKDACHWVLTDALADLNWRIEHQPITKLLGHGPLVEDGDWHKLGRDALADSMQLQACRAYGAAMPAGIDRVTGAWRADTPVDLLDEVRKMALLILMDTLFAVDFSPHMARLWENILHLMHYIAPGAWLLWPGIPAPGAAAARRQIDAYWDAIIRERRREIAADPARPRHDLLSHLVHLAGRGAFDDAFIRDQLMTMLTAGHDTTTGALAWAFYLLGSHRDVQARLRDEIDGALNGSPPDGDNTTGLPFLNAVWKETLRLYPPAHTGNRIAARDLVYEDVKSGKSYCIAAGTRVMYSIFLTQRMSEYFPDPDRFDPDRALHPIHGQRYRPYMYLPFGGGKRNCVGKPFADVMGRVVLARVMQTHDLHLLKRDVVMNMGATIEPRPGVIMGAVRR